MKISPQNFGLALSGYLEQELAPKSDGVRKVVLFMAIPVLTAKMPEVIRDFQQPLEWLGAWTQDGFIEMDVLYPALKDAVHKSGTVPIMGILFDESDVDKVYAMARQFAQ